MSGSQPLEALELANAARVRQAALKRDLRLGLISVAEALNDPRAAGHMPVSRLLQAQARWGPRRTRKLLLALRISENRRVEGLTERERRVIVEPSG